MKTLSRLITRKGGGSPGAGYQRVSPGVYRGPQQPPQRAPMPPQQNQGGMPQANIVGPQLGNPSMNPGQQAPLWMQGIFNQQGGGAQGSIGMQQAQQGAWQTNPSQGGGGSGFSGGMQGKPTGYNGTPQQFNQGGGMQQMPQANIQAPQPPWQPQQGQQEQLGTMQNQYNK